MRCNKFIIVAVLALSLFSSDLRADMISQALEAQDLVFKRDYPAAIESFKELEAKYPDSPTGVFGQMIIWQIMMFENFDMNHSSEYEAAEERFMSFAGDNVEGGVPSWDLFLIGAGYGMRGFYYSKKDQWFRAVGSAIRAMQVLKRLAWEDPLYHDAYLGIGMYNYWRTVFTERFHLLSIFEDKRKEGIRQIELAAEKGKYSSKLARSNLAIIYSNERRHKEARKIIDEFLEAYPENIILRRISGRAYYAARKYDDAKDEFLRILKIDPTMTKSYYYLGMVYARKKGYKKEAREYFEKFLETKPEKMWVNATEKILKQL